MARKAAKGAPTAAEMFVAATGSAPNADALERLTRLIVTARAIDEEVEKAERELKELRNVQRQLYEVDIPSIMDEIGVSRLDLSDGTSVFVETGLSVSTTGRYRDRINQWLRENGFGDVIKHRVVVALAPGEDDKAAEIRRRAEEMGAPVDEIEFVEPSTYKALVRELMEEGREIPLDELGVHVYRKAKIK